MNLAREVEGLRFVAECDDSAEFCLRRIECLACSGEIDPHPPGATLSLTCLNCGDKKVFWSEAQMDVFLAENWNALRQESARSRATPLHSC